MEHDKKSQINEVLGDIVEPGKSWLVRGIYNEILVEQYDFSEAVNRDPELESALIQVSAKLDTAGRNVCWYGMFAIFAICVGIQMHWFDSLIGPKIDLMRSIWVYLLLMVGGLLVAYPIGEWQSYMIYEAKKSLILNAIRNAGKTPKDVIASLKREEDFGSIYDHMKNDKEFFTF